jgi:hypothetical protein
MPETSEQTPLFFRRNDVLQCRDETLYDKIAILAPQLAILGYGSTAASIVGQLNKYDWYHIYGSRLQSLYILWDTMNHWPEGELKRVKKDIQQEREREAKETVKDHQGADTGKKIKLAVDESAITDAVVSKYVGDMYHDYAESWWYPELPHLCGEETPPSPHDRNAELTVEQVKGRMRKLIGAFRGEEGYKREEGNDVNRLDPSAALVSVLDLRMKLHEMGEVDDDGMPNEQELLEMIAERLGERNQIKMLTQSQRAWPILLDGGLMKASGLDKAAVDAFASQLEEAITERMQKGIQQPPTLPMKNLLETIDQNTVTHPDSIDFYNEMQEEVPSTILHSPASVSLIHDTEARLGTTLPEDYKEYLGISNGNEAAFGGILHEPPLSKCEDIRWIEEAEDYFLETTVDIPADMSRIASELYDDALDWPMLGSGIMIASSDVDNIFLCSPKTTKEVQDKVRSILDSSDKKVTKEIKNSVRRAVDDFAGSMNEFEELGWCCIEVKDSEMEAHSSFTAYLRSVAERGRESEKNCWNINYDEFFGKYLQVKP